MMVSYFVPRGRFLIKSCNLRQAQKQQTKWPAFQQLRQTFSTKPKQPLTVTNNSILQKPRPNFTPNKQKVTNERQTLSKTDWRRWTGFFMRWAPFGILMIGAIEWQWHKKKCAEEQIERRASFLQAKIYCSLPLRIMSRCWGWLAACYIPEPLRAFVFGCYASAFDVNMEEALYTDLRHYRSLSEFFTRSLREGVRPIDEGAPIVSPADGRVLHFGTVNENSLIEQVKGVNYSLSSFLGDSNLKNWDSNLKNADSNLKNGDSNLKNRHSNLKNEDSNLKNGDSNMKNGDSNLKNSNSNLKNGDSNLKNSNSNLKNGDSNLKNADSNLKNGDSNLKNGISNMKNEDSNLKNGDSNLLQAIKEHGDQETTLYQCVIYLAPGDYHRFHSPAEWRPVVRRHFAGELLSVNPRVANWLPELFCLNERALYMGSWQYGFFSYTAVGATNVGSVQIFMDEQLKTNRWLGLKVGAHKQKGVFDELQLDGKKSLQKGELLGQFNMGSTIVLIFEAPTNFEFDLEPGKKIQVGQKLGHLA